jgi:hypothetical protein
MVTREFVEMFIKTPLIFLHFFVAALAISAIVRTDLVMLSVMGMKLSENVHQKFQQLKRNLIDMLLILWASGAALVMFAYLAAPKTVFENEKLWMKVAVVLILTLNGFALHFVSKRYKPGITFIDMKGWFLMSCLGVISTTSWAWACFLGVGRAWNHKMPIATILPMYIATLMVGVAVLLIVRMWASKPMNMDASTVEKNIHYFETPEEEEKENRRGGGAWVDTALMAPGPLVKRAKIEKLHGFH